MKIHYFWGLLLLNCTFLGRGSNAAYHQARSHQMIESSNSGTKTTSSKKTKRKRSTTLSTMDYTELVRAKEESQKAKNWDVTIKYLDRMIIKCESDNYLQEKAKLIIELADILFDQQRYDEAAKWYTEFTREHPGDTHIEYASYRAIVCASKKILSIDRDQSATEKTLELATTFLKRGDVFKKYRNEVEKIQHTCYQTLAQSDCNVADFYVKNGYHQAAEHRLKSVRTQWLDKVPEIHTTLASLEVELSTVFPQFQLPTSSIKLAELKSPAKKIDMTARF